MKQQLDDTQIIAQVLRGDTAAYRHIVERHKNLAFTIAMRILNNREEAEEAAQDAFVRAFKGLAGFSGASKFSTWFYRIAMNAALSMREKKQLQTENIDNVAKMPIQENKNELQQQEQRFYLHKALTLLPADDATLVSLFYLKENSIEEIAQVLNIETNNVKVKLHRARKKLAEIMSTLLRGEEKMLI